MKRLHSTNATGADILLELRELEWVAEAALCTAPAYGDPDDCGPIFAQLADCVQSKREEIWETLRLPQ